MVCRYVCDVVMTTGMLKNFPSLPADRIYNMLKMFCTEPPYEQTMTEMMDMLNMMTMTGRLQIIEGNKYANVQ